MLTFVEVTDAALLGCINAEVPQVPRDVRRSNTFVEALISRDPFGQWLFEQRAGVQASSVTHPVWQRTTHGWRAVCEVPSPSGLLL